MSTNEIIEQEDATAGEALFVFATTLADGVTLREIRNVLHKQGYPVGIGVEIAGEAIDAQLDDPAWETALVRWNEPELHDALLLERLHVGNEEEADTIRKQALQMAVNQPKSAGKLIVIDHLRRTEEVYACQILPAVLDDEDHPAWSALDIVLRTIAAPSDGIIYAVDTAFYDVDGEPLISTEEPE